MVNTVIFVVAIMKCTTSTEPITSKFWVRIWMVVTDHPLFQRLAWLVTNISLTNNYVWTVISRYVSAHYTHCLRRAPLNALSARLRSSRYVYMHRWIQVGLFEYVHWVYMGSLPSGYLHCVRLQCSSLLCMFRAPLISIDMHRFRSFIDVVGTMFAGRSIAVLCSVVGGSCWYTPYAWIIDAFFCIPIFHPKP